MRRPLRLVLVLVLLAVVAYLGISWKYADGVTRVVRDPLKKTPAYVQATHEDVSFKSRDGLTLKGWWFPAPGTPSATKAVVMVHGKDQNRIDSSFDPGRIARFLLTDGWSVLLFEMRGHGQSDGLRWGLGEYEPNDILGAIDLAAQKIGHPRSRVATIGESMGGGSVLMTVGKDPSIGPVVVDSAYASAPTECSSFVDPSTSVKRKVTVPDGRSLRTWRDHPPGGRVRPVVCGLWRQDHELSDSALA